MDRKKGQGKGPRQKSSKSVKNIFDTFRHFSRRANNVKNHQRVSKTNFFRHFPTILAGHQFSGPFWGALISGCESISFGAFLYGSPTEKVRSLKVLSKANLFVQVPSPVVSSTVWGGGFESEYGCPGGSLG